MPTKMDLMPGHPANASLLKTNSSAVPKVHAPNMLGNSSDILPHPKKNFTLDHLLSETNGNLDILPQFQDNEGGIYSGAPFMPKNTKIKEKRKNSNNKVKKLEEKMKEMESSPQPESRPESSSSSGLLGSFRNLR